MRASVDLHGFARRYEAALPPSVRRSRGVHFTPPDVCDELVALALDGLTARTPRVCDPSCGGGDFLLAAGRALASRGLTPPVIARDLLWGLDIDRGAVDVARRAIVAWSGVDPANHLVVADALAFGDWRGRFDVVVGNPPFQNQLERATVRVAPLADAWRPFAPAYADTAWLFLLVAFGFVRTGGRVVMIQPQSVASARDAGAVREEVERLAALEGMWTADAGVFDAHVRVCAPVLTVGRAPRTSTVRRWRDRGFVPCPDRPRPRSTWGPLLARDDEPPTFAPATTGGALGSIATATAGFRDQFYGLAPCVVDRLDVEDERAHPRLVTSGLIDVGVCDWGERTARFAGRQWQAPRVDVSRIERTALRNWVEQRLTPKVVVATQTKVIEAAVDVAGTWVPSTPVVAVTPVSPADLWPVAAVLLAPPVSALAASTYAGAALQSGAIKLSAKQVLDLPLPTQGGRWNEAARALRAGDVAAAAHAMTHAYDAPDEVLAWWNRRNVPGKRGGNGHH